MWYGFVVFYLFLSFLVVMLMLDFEAGGCNCVARLYIFGCDLILGYQVRCWVHGLGGGARCIAIIKLDYMFVAISRFSSYFLAIPTHLSDGHPQLLRHGRRRIGVYFVKRCWCTLRRETEPSDMR